MSLHIKYFKIILISLIFFSLGEALKGQDNHGSYAVVDVEDLFGQIKIDKKVHESSGLIVFLDFLWTINDSGNQAELFKIDPKTGEVAQTIEVEGVENNDWEALTQDEDHIYIGDFGNNRGRRKNLMIYKITKNDIHKTKDCKVSAEIIRYAYVDQTNFKPENQRHNFDCEGLISHGDSLLLFTKNRGNLKTTLYAVPKNPGNYNLEPTGSFNVNGYVTGAAFNKNNSKLLLIGYRNYVPFIFVFDDFHGRFDKLNQVVRYNFPTLENTQTEGIDWIDEDNIYISTEQTKEVNQGVYLIDLKQISR